MSEAGQGNTRKRPKRRLELSAEQRCKRFNGTAKAAYRSEAKARKAARLHPKTEGGSRLYTYCCPRCGFWHLTHEPPRV
jgi:rubrerythrin